MPWKKRVINSFYILTLLALPALTLSIYFLSLLLNQLFSYLSSLDDTLYYLFLIFGIGVLIPIPPPSRRKFKIFYQYCIYNIRRLIQRKSSENYTITDKLDVHSVLEDDLQTQSSSLISLSYSPLRIANASSPQHDSFLSDTIHESLYFLNTWSRNKIRLKKSFINFFLSLFSFLKNCWISFFSRWRGSIRKGLCNVISKNLSIFSSCGDAT